MAFLNTNKYLASVNTSQHCRPHDTKSNVTSISRHARARQAWRTHLSQDTIKPL